MIISFFKPRPGLLALQPPIVCIYNTLNNVILIARLLWNAIYALCVYRYHPALYFPPPESAKKKRVVKETY